MSRPSKSSGQSKSDKESAGSTWRTAPDNHSYQKNQKFALASQDVKPKSFELAEGEKLLKPVFAKVTTNVIPAVHSNKNKPTAPVPVVSSRTMKASAPIVRGQVEVIDAGELLKKFDEDAIAMRAPKEKRRKPIAQQDDATMEDADKPVTNSAVRKQFAATAAEVEKLGATGLNKWDRKLWEREQDKLLGIKPAPLPKAPFKMFLGLESKKEERAKRKRDNDREQGLEVRKESDFAKDKKARFAENDAREEEAAGSWKMKIGKSHRGGVLSLHRSEIQNISGRGGRGRGGGFSGRGRGGSRGGRGRGR